MTKYIGRLVNVGVGRESTRGAGASPVYQIPRADLSFDDKVVKARSVGSLGKISDSEEAFVTTKYGQGDIGAEIRSKSFGLFLYAMLGSLSSGSVVDSSYTHTVSIDQGNQHQSLSFVVADENTTELYKLVMLDSLEIVSELDEIVRFNATFMSKKGNATGLTVPVPVAEHKFTKKHLSFKVASTIGGLGAAQAISVKSLIFTIQKNVILDDVLGTAEPEDILNRQLSVEGQLTLNYENETWKNYMRDDTQRAVEIAFTNQDVEIGVVPTRPALTFQLPKVDFFDWEPDNTLDEVVTQTISFKANRDLTNALDIISLCTLVNEVETYA